MTLNEAILQAITKLNEHREKGYHWDSSGSTGGSIGDVLWEDKIILRGDPEYRTYCCGITLQAYLMGCAIIHKHLGSPSDVLAIKKKWFIEKFVEPLYLNKGPVDALVPLGLAREVSIEEAQPGDLCQIWRANGWGHSVIFINSFIENDFRALKYWSSQKLTKGIGYRTEYFGGVQNPITHAYLCRPL